MISEAVELMECRNAIPLLEYTVHNQSFPTRIAIILFAVSNEVH